MSMQLCKSLSGRNALSHEMAKNDFCGLAKLQTLLANALGGGEQGWAVLMDLSERKLDELQRAFLDGSMSIDKAASAILTELTTEDAKT